MGDSSSTRPAQQSVWKQQRGQLKWCPAIETAPCCAVDMVHHSYDLVLDQRGEGTPFGEDIANRFMVLFQPSLLLRGHGVAIEYVRPALAGKISLQQGRIFEFWAIVS